jgi:hypothetical protein
MMDYNEEASDTGGKKVARKVKRVKKRVTRLKKKSSKLEKKGQKARDAKRGGNVKKFYRKGKKQLKVDAKIETAESKLGSVLGAKAKKSKDTYS